MSRRLWIAPLCALALAASLSTGAAAKGPAAKAPPAAAIGKTESAQWSSTTIEAAVEEANKKILASGKAATVTGEIVDVSCYLQLGRRGLAHVACATKCINNGQPIGIVDAEDQLYLLFPEPHHPRRDGQASIKDTFLPYLAQQVRVTGMMTNLRGGIRALYVQPANVAAEPKPDGATNK